MYCCGISRLAYLTYTWHLQWCKFRGVGWQSVPAWWRNERWQGGRPLRRGFQAWEICSGTTISIFGMHLKMVQTVIPVVYVLMCFRWSRVFTRISFQTRWGLWSDRDNVFYGRSFWDKKSEAPGILWSTDPYTDQWLWAWTTWPFLWFEGGMLEFRVEDWCQGATSSKFYQTSDKVRNFPLGHRNIRSTIKKKWREGAW